MKAGIVGVGAVGASTAMAIAMRGRIRDLVLVNRNRARAKGVATDISYGIPLSGDSSIRDGDYEDLAGAGVVIIAAGVNEKAGGATDRQDPAGRLRLLEANAKIFGSIVPKIVTAAPEAVILVATDPPEPLTELARTFAGHQRVLGTGTHLDSLRFRVHLADRLRLHAKDVDAYVVGEHGTSGVFLWTSAHIGGMRIKDLIAWRGFEFDDVRRAVEHDVRYANISIIEGIGASQYGIGMVTARIAEAILNDEQAVIAVGSYSKRYNIALSLPSILGRDGVVDVLWPEMSRGELDALERSGAILRDAMSKYASQGG
jgi:L-lactate dehydrogenase